MLPNLKRLFISILIETVSFLTVGFIFMGSFIFRTDNTGFAYTIFGITSIILINVLKFRSLRDFLFTSALLTFFFLVTFFKIENLLPAMRNVLWFAVICVSVFLSVKVLSGEKYKTKKYVSAAIWMINFTLVYIFMALLNIYIFKFYDENYFSHYMLLAFNMGASMGLGIGIGFEICKNLKWKIN